ncbi:MAG: hypothetical protein DMG05_09140 [Acidobacteria bacterium]|nr:MAG: hypothetical protein DMG05_09140 [Acidobacteriota bacterium]
MTNSLTHCETACKNPGRGCVLGVGPSKVLICVRKARKRTKIEVLKQHFTASNQPDERDSHTIRQSNAGELFGKIVVAPRLWKAVSI